MKKFLKILLEQLKLFLDSDKTDSHDSADSLEEIYNQIELALYKKAAVHVIFQQHSLTGDIIQYDRSRQRLILKHFKHQITNIIHIPDIKKVILVPNSVKQSQQVERLPLNEQAN